MKTNLARMQQRVLLRMAEGTKIILHYKVLTEATVDPVSGTTSGTSTSKQKIFRGFFHEIGPATSGLRIYSEVEIGNAIIDMPPATQLEGLLDPEFEVDGRRWVQKQVGKELAQSWDVVWRDQRITRTILVQRKTVYNS